MFTQKTVRLLAAFAIVFAMIFGATGVSPARADTISTSFDSFILGNINGQDGWSKTGPYDVAVVANTYGYASFGSQSLRISDAFADGAFGGQAYSKPLVNAVGEAAATAGAFAVGTRQSHFEMQFDIASTQSTQQTGMHVSVSPDRGDGSRMSYLRFEDGASGINVFFDDALGTTSPIIWNETQIATGLSRAVPHTVKLTMDTLDGPSNDIVKVYIDGTLVQTGTSWENYYRYDVEAAGEQSPRIVRSVGFIVRGSPTPANVDKGYLIDNLSLSTSGDATVTVNPSSPNGWYFYDDDFPGGLGEFVSGPGTPPAGTGSAHMTLAGTARQTITTLAYAGTRFDKVTALQYSTYGSVSTLQLNIDFDLTDTDNTTWMGRLVYIPSGGVTSGGWTQWNPLSGSWYTTAGAGRAVVGGVPGNSVCPVSTPCTWAQLLSSYPNAGIRINDGGIHLKAGGPQPGFDGNVDAFKIGINSINTTYDFEGGTTALVFVPTATLISVGGKTYVGINLNNVVNLYGYQFQVNYDASKASASAFFADTPPTGFPPFHFFVTTPPAVIPGGYNAQCSAGVCQFAVSHVVPQTPVSGSGPLAFVVLTGVAPGTFNVTFSGDTLSDIDANPIAHSSGATAITVYGAATVNGTVTMQGRATLINSGTVTLTDLGGNFPPMVTNFDPGTGVFSFTGVPVLPGGSNYQFDAAHSLYLGNRQIHTLSPADSYTAPTTKLRGGDANNDGTIDMLDLSCIGGDFGGPPNFCTPLPTSSDITADGTVNILDLVLAGGNYGLSAPRPW